MKKLCVTTVEYLRLEAAFRAWLEALGYAPSTVYNVPNAVREFFHWLEEQGLLGLQAVESLDVVAYLGMLSERPNQRRGGGLSQNSLRSHHKALRLLSRYLLETGQGGLAVPSLQEAKHASRVLRVLSRGEVAALYAVCTDDALGMRDRCMLSLYYGCGLRRSEAVGLQVEEVLFERSCLYVRQTKTRHERYVPLVGWVHDDLRSYLEHVRPRWARAGEQALLVSRQYGRRIGGQALALRLERLCARARLDTVHLHSLRHAVATHLLEGGLPLDRVGQFLGHRSLESTQLYTHVADRLSDGAL